jgi:hypothetical protein
MSCKHSHLSRSILFCRIVVIGLTLALLARRLKEGFLSSAGQSLSMPALGIRPHNESLVFRVPEQRSPQIQ